MFHYANLIDACVFVCSFAEVAGLLYASHISRKQEVMIDLSPDAL